MEESQFLGKKYEKFPLKYGNIITSPSKIIQELKKTNYNMTLLNINQPHKNNTEQIHINKPTINTKPH